MFSCDSLPGSERRSLCRLTSANDQMLAGIDIDIQLLGETNAVKLAADFTAFFQPVRELFADEELYE